MKKILYIFICLLSFKVCAQTTPEDLFNFSDNSILGESTRKTFTGKPVVLIEKEAKPQVEINKAEQLPPLDLGMNDLNIPIKTFFGHDRTATFIDHTTDFLIIAQVLDNENVRITEQIQFITTKDGEKFKRFFPDKIYGSAGKEFISKPKFLSLKQDTSFVPFVINTKPNGIEILYDTPLSKGVHRMTLEYLLSDPFKANKTLTETILPVTGPNWAQIIERLTMIIIMPQKSHFYKKEFLFGTNNQSIPENIKITEDDKGVLLFQNTRPIPAFGDIKAHLLFDAKDLPVTSTEQNSNMMIMGIFVLVLLGYMALSILTARIKKWKNPLTESKNINPILWALELKENLMDYHVELLQNTGLLQYFLKKNLGCGKILAFIRFNIEYMIGSVLLILATKYVARYYGVELSLYLYGIFLILGGMAILIINHYGTRIQMKHLIDLLKNNLLNEPWGVSLAKREIPTYYQIAICFNFHEIWKKRLLANNPTYQDLSCFKKEEKL